MSLPEYDRNKAALPMRGLLRFLPAPLLTMAALCTAIPSQARVFQTVEVRGAQFIPEADIRATCGAFDGVDYTTYDLRAIEDCLMLTGVFDSVRLAPEGDTLVIEVSEIDTRPGRIEGGLAYVSQEGLTAELAFEQYNLFPDTYGALRLAYNPEVATAEAHLYRNQAFGPDLHLGLDLLARETDFDDRSFDERIYQVEPYLAWTPGDHLRFEAAIGWREYRQFGTDPSASALLQQEEDAALSAPYVRFSMGYKSVAEPTEGREGWAQPGYSVELQQHFWNLGTDAPLSDTRFEMRTQYPLGPGYRLLTGLRAGTLRGLDGNATRAIDRYYPGADTFRGFAPRGIGPRDAGDALGGNHYAVGTVEVQRDFGTVMTLPMRGGLFFETGASWGLDDTLGGQIDDGFHARSALGLSLTVEVATVPVSLYLAHPIRKQAGDETQTFGLGFTARF